MSKELYLGGKHGSVIGNYAIVDDEDYERVLQYKWYCLKMDKRYYPSTTINGKEKPLHRFIMNITDPKIEVDHKNHNTLDARKENLRPCTRLNNAHNIRKYKGKNPYKGVWITPLGKFIAHIKYKDKRYNLGTYSTAEEAGMAYDIAAIKYHGEFACLNFPEKDYKTLQHPKPVVNNKTGERYISYDSKRNSFQISLKIGKKRYSTRKPSLEEAVKYRDELLKQRGESYEFKCTRGY